MWIADVVKESASKIRPSLNWKEMLSRPEKPAADRGPSVAKDVTKNEFEQRYSRLRSAQIVIIIMMLLDLVVFTTTTGMMAAISCLLVFSIYFVFYVRYCYTAWAARKIWADWEKRELPFLYTMKDFWDALAADPALLLPSQIRR